MTEAINTNTNVNSLHQDMKIWQRKHEENVITSQAFKDISLFNASSEKEALLANITGSKSYEERTQEIGQYFDFMQGKDVNNRDEYEAQLALLAQGDFSETDLNQNGEVSLGEYTASQLKGVLEGDDDEFIAQTKATSFLMFRLMDEAMGNSDKSGELSKEEYMSFYENMDKFDGSGIGEADGKLDIETASTMVDFLTTNMFTKEYRDIVLKNFHN